MKLKKEFILIITIFTSIILLEIVTSVISNNSVEKTVEQLQNLKSNLEKAINLDINNTNNQELKENLNKEISDLKEEWFKEEKKLSFFAEHDELEKISSSLVILQENLENQAYDIALERCAETGYWLNHLKDKEKLALKNIF